jgi:outer membrane protein assembly factor BamB
LDLDTGAERWRANAAGAVDAAPAVAEGPVFVGDRAGVFHAFDAATGKELWTFREDMPVPFPWGYESGDIYRSSATIADGMVIFGGTDGFVFNAHPHFHLVVLDGSHRLHSEKQQRPYRDLPGRPIGGGGSDLRSACGRSSIVSSVGGQAFE